MITSVLNHLVRVQKRKQLLSFLGWISSLKERISSLDLKGELKCYLKVILTSFMGWRGNYSLCVELILVFVGSNEDYFGFKKAMQI